QCSSCIPSRNITSNQSCFWKMIADFFDLAQYPSCVTMSSIDNDRISTSFEQCFCSFKSITGYTNCCSTEQMVLIISCGLCSTSWHNYALYVGYFTSLRLN